MQENFQRSGAADTASGAPLENKVEGYWLGSRLTHTTPQHCFDCQALEPVWTGVRNREIRQLFCVYAAYAAPTQSTYPGSRFPAGPALHAPMVVGMDSTRSIGHRARLKQVLEGSLRQDGAAP